MSADPAFSQLARSAEATAVGTPLSRALVVLGAFIIGATAVVAGLHLDDRFFVSHVSSTWIALTFAADHGVLYPALFDGEHFGGTRYMPLSIALHWLAAQLSGEYLLSAKLLGALACGALLAVTFRTLTQLGASRALALTLLASVLASTPGQLAALSVRGDALPTLLQLLSLRAIVGARRAQPTRANVHAAACLCALALLAKLTAIWAALSIGVWLLQRERRRVLDFALVYGLVLSAGAVAFNSLSDGRMLQNLAPLSVAGVSGPLAFVRAPLRLSYLLIHEATTLWALLPIAAAGALLDRRLDLYQLGLISALLLVMLVLADEGAMVNHLLDLSVLAAICTTHVLAHRSLSGTARWLLKLVVLWTVASGFATLAWPEIKTGLATAAAPEAHSRAQLSDLMRPGESVLSEDPLIPVLHGQRPIIADAYMLRAIGQHHPHLVQAGLVDRIARAAFDRIILLEEADPEDAWYQQHLGPNVVAAVRAHYHLAARSHGYHIYLPRSDAKTTP